MRSESAVFLACKQALLFGRVRGHAASPLARAFSLETRFARPNKRAWLQAGKTADSDLFNSISKRNRYRWTGKPFDFDSTSKKSVWFLVYCYLEDKFEAGLVGPCSDARVSKVQKINGQERCWFLFLWCVRLRTLWCVLLGVIVQSLKRVTHLVPCKRTQLCGGLLRPFADSLNLC